jgi:hypothetical protein
LEPSLVFLGGSELSVVAGGYVDGEYFFGSFFG